MQKFIAEKHVNSLGYLKGYTDKHGQTKFSMRLAGRMNTAILMHV